MNKDKKLPKKIILIVLACLLAPQGLSMALVSETAAIDPPDWIADATMDNPIDSGVDNAQEDAVKRGEAVHMVVESFDLAEQQTKFLKDCLLHLPECFFAFSARSDYDLIRFDPLILYPDVFPAYKYYRDINTASMLGLVQGYLESEQTPFRPEAPVTRIEALKIVLGAANLMAWKEQFELAEAESELKLVAAADNYDHEGSWWYPRYVNFALDAGILAEDSVYMPDEEITVSDLTKMIEKTLSYKKQLGANIK